MQSASLRRCAPSIAIASAISVAALTLYLRDANAQETPKPVDPAAATTNAPAATAPANPPAANITPPAVSGQAPAAAASGAAPAAPAPAPKDPALPEVKIIQDKAKAPPPPAFEQAAPKPKPKVAPVAEVYEDVAPEPKAKKKPAGVKPTPTAKVTKKSPAPSQAAVEQVQQIPAEAATLSAPAVGSRSGSLTVPTEAEARAEINRTPGAVDVVPSSDFAKSTPGSTVKEAFDYVPGVLIRPSEGDYSSHFSIRGSGLSRNADIRGVKFLMDGVIPLTRATGDSSFDDLDPSMFRYIEVYKGANALQYGAASLGGAVNFVSPTGYDSSLFGARYDFGSFGFSKWTATSGGVYGAADYFISISGMKEDGYRDHSEGDYLRGMANVGYRFNKDVETRFYLNASETKRESAGSLTKTAALTTPTIASTSPGTQFFGIPPPRNFGNDNLEWDIRKETNAWQIANKTTIRVAPGTVVDVGAFYVDRDYDQYVFDVITTTMNEHGGFIRLVDDRQIAGYRNRLVAGVSLHDGDQLRQQYINVFGSRGTLRGSVEQKSTNTTLYAEDSLFVLPDIALVAGLQHVKAGRVQEDNPLAAGNQAFDLDFTFTNPKIGFLWDLTPRAQIYGNISKSSEAPTFSELPTAITSPGPNLTAALKPQEAVTYEIGTRGDYGDFKWQVAAYRSNLENEYQCITTAPNTAFCLQTNLPRSIHQGIEVGASAALFKGLFATGANPDSIWLNAAYSFSDFRFDGSPTFGNNELPGQPRHYLRSELLYKHSSGFYAGPNMEYVGEYFVNNINTMSVDSYTLWGAKLGYDAGGRIAAYVEGRNLSDERHISSANVVNDGTATSTIYYPGNGRAFYAGIQFRW